MEKLLINGLKLCGVRKGIAAAIFMVLQSDKQMMEMCLYIVKHKKASEQELLNVAREIAGMAE